MVIYEQNPKENDQKIFEEDVKVIESGYENAMFETNKRNPTKILYDRRNEEEMNKVDEENSSRIYLNFNHTPNLTKKGIMNIKKPLQ